MAEADKCQGQPNPLRYHALSFRRMLFFICFATLWTESICSEMLDDVDSVALLQNWLSHMGGHASSVNRVKVQAESIMENGRTFVQQTLQRATKPDELLHAARSAGLPWSTGDATNFSQQLQSTLVLLHEATPGKMNALQSIASKCQKNENCSSMATTGLESFMDNFFTQGKTVQESLLRTGVDVVVAGISMSFPIGGILAGILAGGILDLLFPEEDQPDPLQQLSRSFLDRAGTMMDRKLIQSAVGERRVELLAIQRQLMWVPSMLTGQLDDTKRLVLQSFNLMLQHDLSTISLKIRDHSFQADSVPDREWAYAIMPLAHMVMVEQVSLLTEIAIYDETYKPYILQQIKAIVLTDKSPPSWTFWSHSRYVDATNYINDEFAKLVWGNRNAYHDSVSPHVIPWCVVNAKVNVPILGSMDMASLAGCDPTEWKQPCATVGRNCNSGRWSWGVVVRRADKSPPPSDKCPRDGDSFRDKDMEAGFARLCAETDKQPLKSKIQGQFDTYKKVFDNMTKAVIKLNSTESNLSKVFGNVSKYGNPSLEFMNKRVAFYNRATDRWLRLPRPKAADAVNWGTAEYDAGWLFEKFEVQDCGQGQVALWNKALDQWVRVNDKFVVDSNGNGHGRNGLPAGWTWEQFYIRKVSEDLYLLESSFHQGHFLTMGTNGGSSSPVTAPTDIGASALIEIRLVQ